MLLPPDIHEILAALANAGHRAFVVGGCVRDTLLGRTPADWDIATSSLPEQTRAIFAGHLVIPTGLAHGTLTLLWNGKPYEITTFRADGPYSDGRRPDSVRFGASLTEDLARRDFTMNAMAYSPAEGLADPFGGRADLARGLIRCVGDPAARFAEDALRILRVARFAAVLGFSAEESTKNAAFSLQSRLSLVATERKTAELQKLLAGPFAGRAVSEFFPLWQAAYQAAAPSALLPPSVPTTVFDDARAIPSLSLAFFLSGTPDPAALLSSFRLPSALSSSVVRIATWLPTPCPATEGAVRRFLSRLPEADARAVLLGWRLLGREHAEKATCIAAEAFARGDCLSVSTLAVTGGELLALGVPPGPAVGSLKNKLFELVLEGQVKNEKSRLLEAARKILS